MFIIGDLFGSPRQGAAAWFCHESTMLRRWWPKPRIIGYAGMFADQRLASGAGHAKARSRR